jgi:hypothetical protein
MARAKSTARADARRRHRADSGLPDEAIEPGAANTPEEARRDAVPARISIIAAFRQSFRPLDLRGDLLALPAVALRSKALWLPLLLTIGTTVAFAITAGSDIVTRFLFAYFVQTPAIGGVFIAGFLAPRASWLLGLIVGLVSAICYAVLIMTVFAAVTAASPTPGLAGDAIVSAFLLSPIMGLLFASAAAWYRRFLQLSSPNRGRHAQAARRGPDGRTRGGTQGAARR